MNGIRGSQVLRTLLLPFLLTAWLAACSKWVTVAPPETVLTEQAAQPEGGRDRLRLFDGDERVAEGRLRELTPDSVLIYDDATPRKVAREEITKVEVQKANNVASAGVFLGVLAGLAGLLLVVALASFDFQ